MMSVFTFMGANILRQDDSYTFRVITRILETVFPVLFMVCVIILTVALFVNRIITEI